VLRAALYSFLLAGLSAAWLATTPIAGCVITLDESLAELGVVFGTLGTVVFVLVAVAQAFARWWDERRSRTWRLL
jgi:hypothetical protein